MLYILRGHQQQVHVLSAHPVCPHVVMSAGYDGRMVIWDLSGGRVLRTFGTQDRGGTDTDPVQVLDGHFSQDGTSIVLSDTAGQVRCHLCIALPKYLPSLPTYPPNFAFSIICPIAPGLHLFYWKPPAPGDGSI